jgi:predicted TPR repeat methyltransferase
LIDKSDSYEIIEQSEQMVERFKQRIKNDAVKVNNVDFLSFSSDKKFNTIFAIRCFEYFSDKKKALEIMSNSLKDNGTIIITTKNPNHFSSQNKKTTLHKDQISVKDMKETANNVGLKVNKIYPTVVRVKSKYLLFRLISRIIFQFAFITRLRVFDIFTESYTYVIKKQP